MKFEKENPQTKHHYRLKSGQFLLLLETAFTPRRMAQPDRSLDAASRRLQQPAFVVELNDNDVL
jgi:hypothetical protein